MDESMDKKIFEFKKGTYDDANKDNFVAPAELTVTITLNEYRALVSTAANTKAKVDEANKDKYKREDEIKKLNEKIVELTTENTGLKSQLYEIQKKVISSEYGMAVSESEEEE